MAQAMVVQLGPLVNRYQELMEKAETIRGVKYTFGYFLKL